jgi:hypothetical protein
VTEINLSFLNLYRFNSREWNNFPGLALAPRPARPARGRERDQLIIFLLLAGNKPYNSAEYRAATQTLTDEFYNTPGSVTFALRAAADALNAEMLERNLQNAAEKQYGIGLLVMGALRGDALYTVQCGATHIFVLNAQGAQHIHDPALSGRGLGASQSLKTHFSHLQLNPGEQLVFGLQMPPEMPAQLGAQRAANSLDVLRRRVTGMTIANINLALMQISEGDGTLTMLEIAAPAQNDPQPASVNQPEPQPEPAPTSQASPAPALTRPPLQRPSPPPAATPPPVSAPAERKPLQAAAPAPEKPKITLPEMPPAVKTARKGAQKVFGWLAEGIRLSRVAGEKISAFFNKFAPRLLPDGSGNLSGTLLLFIAIAVPLILSTLASTIYFSQGQTRQYNDLLVVAEEEAQFGMRATDPTDIRLHWERVIYWLDKAQQIQTTERDRTLRAQAQFALDGLDRITRVNLQLTADKTWSASYKITQMVANERDVYLLDSEKGKILRAAAVTGGYVLDEQFRCEPGKYNNGEVYALQHLFALPRTGNSMNASIVGVDAYGTLLYCSPNKDPIVAALLPPPGNRPFSITALTFDGSNLFILDAQNSAIWQYYGNQGAFPAPPIFFFQAQVPESIAQSVDIAANADDLYILRGDGRLIVCTLSRIDAAPTRCTDPATFTDTRPGRQSGTLIPDTRFSQIEFTSPPDALIAMLDPNGQAVYRFSPRALDLQNQYKPISGRDSVVPAGAASAFTISPSKILFVIINQKLYYAPLP